MPAFLILLRTDTHLFECEPAGAKVRKDAFHFVAIVSAMTIDEVYSRCQNGNPDLDNETKTWAKDARVDLSFEGDRLRCPKMNDSLRSVSVGDVVIDHDDKLWMVDSCGWMRLEEDEDGIHYVVCEE